jgi:hypothetical protein
MLLKQKLQIILIIQHYVTNMKRYYGNHQLLIKIWLIYICLVHV